VPRSVFGEGLDIFSHRDIERARGLQAKDDRVALLYSEVLNLIVNPFDGNGGAPRCRECCFLTGLPLLWRRCARITNLWLVNNRKRRWAVPER
jgi:hypothetical protein